jgi:tetratricopeptide (TPR) repeat protein
MTHLLASLPLLLLVTAPQAETETLADKVHRQEARRHYRAGEAYMGRESFEKAVAEFRTATGLDPDFVLAHYSLGQALMALNRHQEALDAYTAAREAIVAASHLNQKDRAALERDRRDQINELQESLQFVRSGKIKGTGGATTALETRIEQQLDQLREAEQRDAETGPRIPAELSLALGSAHFHLGQLEDAEREYRAAIRTKGSLGAAHNNLAVVCMMSGRYEEARTEIRAAESAGFFVSPGLKDELETRASASSSP